MGDYKSSVVHYRSQEASPFHELKIEGPVFAEWVSACELTTDLAVGVMSVPIQSVLAVINEVDLFNTWVPMLRVRLIVRMRMLVVYM